MKMRSYILFAMVLLVSCNKETENGNEMGTVIYQINFTTDAISIKSEKSDPDSLYNQFGNYITSLTPSKFMASIWTIGYVDTVFSQSDNNAQMLQYVEQNGEILPHDDPSRIVDFSNNMTVTFNPVRYGRVNLEGQFADQQIDFVYFYFLPKYFYQEVDLPVEYQGVQLNMFLENTVENNVLKVRHAEMMNKIFPNAMTGGDFYFIFGETDSTFVVNPNGELVPTSVDNPISVATQSLIIRSDKYSSMIYHAPLPGDTLTMNGVLSIITDNLIQVYAGADNIPYTSDDIFVYAPAFWERIYSRLDMN